MVMDPSVRLFLLELIARSAIGSEEATRIEGLAAAGADPEALVRAAGVDEEAWLAAATAAPACHRPRAMASICNRWMGSATNCARATFHSNATIGSA